MSTTKGKTRIEPFKEQLPFLQDDKRYLGYVSGVGAGKTFAGIVRTIRNMQEWNPGEMGAIIAPTRQMVVNVIIPEMRELGLFDDNIGWEYKSAYSDEPGIHAPNGARALILSADNKQTVERLRGLNLAFVWMDERTAIPKRAQDIAMQRLRTGNYRNLFMTTTPKGKDDTYDFFVGDVDAAESDHGMATLYETEDRRAIVGVPSEANPHTPTDYKEAMRKDLPDALVAQEVEGNFVEIGSGVLTKDMLTFVHASELPDREMKYVLGVDVGVTADATEARENDSDYWAVSLIALDKLGGQAFLADLHRKRGMSLNQGVKWISKVASSVPNPSIHIEANQAQRWLLQQCQDEGLNVSPVQNTEKKEDRLIQLSVPFENDTIQIVNREVDEQIGYDPRWQELVQEWIAFPDGSHDDAIDSVEIAMNAVDVPSARSIMGANPYGGNNE